MPKKISRCAWAGEVSLPYIEYHDKEWGVPVWDDKTQFEFLILEGAQAGLSWSTILNKRDGYRKNFADFDVAATGAVTIVPDSNVTALTLTGTNVTTGTFAAFTSTSSAPSSACTTSEWPPSHAIYRGVLSPYWGRHGRVERATAHRGGISVTHMSGQWLVWRCN